MQDEDLNRQTRGLMRLFKHQVNHTEFVTKTAQPKQTFWKSVILGSNHPTC